MSGGSWDYLCYRMDDAADQLECSKGPLRQALGTHMRKVAKAMHDIEWVDSHDYAPGDEVDAIRAAIGEDGDADDGSGPMSDETDLRQRFQEWSRQQRGSLDGCLRSIAMDEPDLPYGTTLPMAAEAALREIVTLRATLDRVRELPAQWREASEDCDYGHSDYLRGCAAELKRALDGKP